jgi:NAD(P)-dependent dehydrogenase (short-subunit alcohol dehydrogenase family)
MSVDFAKAVLAEGHAVCDLGPQPRRHFPRLRSRLQPSSVRLDMTTRGDAEAPMRAAIERFGRIDGVNNAASICAVYFEDLHRLGRRRWHPLAASFFVDSRRDVSLVGPLALGRRGFGLLLPSRLSATAARIRSFNAGSLIFSLSWMSMARRTFPSRLELNRPEGSFNAAPAFLCCTLVQRDTGLCLDLCIAEFFGNSGFLVEDHRFVRQSLSL